jgi:hypothetical protein
LILSQNLSYNDLASAAIDQEGTMRACDTAEEKKRKWTMLGSSGGSSRCPPEVAHGLHATRGTATLTSTILGQPPTVPAVAIAIAVQPHTFHSTAAGDSHATTTVHAS